MVGGGRPKFCPVLDMAPQSPSCQLRLFLEAAAHPLRWLADRTCHYPPPPGPPDYPPEQEPCQPFQQRLPMGPVLLGPLPPRLVGPEDGAGADENSIPC